MAATLDPDAAKTFLTLLEELWNEKKFEAFAELHDLKVTTVSPEGMVRGREAFLDVIRKEDLEESSSAETVVKLELVEFRLLAPASQGSSAWASVLASLLFKNTRQEVEGHLLMILELRDGMQPSIVQSVCC